MNKIFKIVLMFFLYISLTSKIANANEDKIKIGLLIPITGDNKNLGKLIIKSTRMALQDINNNMIEIYPKDTASSPEQTLQSAIKLPVNFYTFIRRIQRVELNQNYG